MEEVPQFPFHTERLGQHPAGDLLYLTPLSFGRASLVSAVRPSLTALRNVLALRVTIRAGQSRSFRPLREVLPVAGAFHVIAWLPLFGEPFALPFFPPASDPAGTEPAQQK
uniref:hypothetical protein n=1 Tax=Photobacterium gaetbulicola TaxID=1295392 RepID=UPI00155DD8AE|nr:hypothetical protein [Photobacterium gaetbulicola]